MGGGPDMGVPICRGGVPTATPLPPPQIDPAPHWIYGAELLYGANMGLGVFWGLGVPVGGEGLICGSLCGVWGSLCVGGPHFHPLPPPQIDPATHWIYGAELHGANMGLGVGFWGPGGGCPYMGGVLIRGSLCGVWRSLCGGGPHHHPPPTSPNRPRTPLDLWGRASL